MIGIIVSGHGEFASAFGKTIEYIIGEQEKTKFINFNNGMGTKELEDKFKEAISSLNVDEGILFITDLAGGTPFSTAVTISLTNKENIKVIGGSNIPTILSALELREEGNCLDNIDEILNYAKDAIITFEDSAQETCSDLDEDGI